MAEMTRERIWTSPMGRRFQPFTSPESKVTQRSPRTPSCDKRVCDDDERTNNLRNNVVNNEYILHIFK